MILIFYKSLSHSYFKIEIFCNMMNVFTVTFDKFKGLKKMISPQFFE